MIEKTSSHNRQTSVFGLAASKSTSGVWVIFMEHKIGAMVKCQVILTAHITHERHQLFFLTYSRL